MSKQSVLLLSFRNASTAEMLCAMTVARATPGTPRPRFATKYISRKMFSTVAIIRYISADTESPSPLSMPPRIL